MTDGERMRMTLGAERSMRCTFGFIGLAGWKKKLTKFLSPFSPKSMTFYDPFIKEKPENVSRLQT